MTSPPLDPRARTRRSSRRAGAILAVATLALMLWLAAGARAASTFIIRGGGFGHGIGMSQYGADGYALHGASYQFILAHYYQHTQLGTTNPDRIVRVLLATGSASLLGADSAEGAGQTAAVKLTPGTTYDVVTLGSGKLSLRTSAGRSVGSFTAPLTVSGRSNLQVPGLGTYRGSLEFRPDGSGGVQTVNALGLDDYVRGVVADEMPSSWQTAALEAQAVAARTYAITGDVGGNGYDLYSDTRSQMYGGVNAETPSSNAAVAATAGQIVTYHGHPATTYFFSSSGGYTESIQNVWIGATPEPWLVGVPDPYDGVAGNPYHSWGARLSMSSAASKLAGLFRGRLVGIVVTKHGVSPRILQAKVVGTRWSSTVSGQQLQSIFGLQTTFAAFTTITTSVSHGILTGTLFPAPTRGSVALQTIAAGGWHTLTHVSLGSGGRFTATLRTAGRFRVTFGKWTGPAVSGTAAPPGTGNPSGTTHGGGSHSGGGSGSGTGGTGIGG